MKYWFLAGVVVLVAACGSAPEAPADDDVAAATSTPAATPAEPTSRPEPTSPGKGPSQPTPAALDFTASLVGGGQIEGGDLAGRDVALWFWAPW